MLILVSGGTKTVNRLAGHPCLGSLITPQAGNLPPANMPWAADNAAFSNWDELKFLRMLESLSTHETKPLFVASPDVVGNAVETDKLYRRWEGEIRRHGFPVALVLQNGQESIGIPWHKIDAIFIGGDNHFKLGKYVRWAVTRAKQEGKWVHMGRVNSMKRIDYAREIGCDSVDGTACSRFSETFLPRFLRHLEREQYSMGFF